VRRQVEEAHDHPERDEGVRDKDGGDVVLEQDARVEDRRLALDVLARDARLGRGDEHQEAQPRPGRGEEVLALEEHQPQTDHGAEEADPRHRLELVLDREALGDDAPGDERERVEPDGDHEHAHARDREPNGVRSRKPAAGSGARRRTPSTPHSKALARL
jgi:hypothetical protein